MVKLILLQMVLLTNNLNLASLEGHVVTVKAYCPCKICCGVVTNLTSTGKNAKRNGVAVPSRAIPYGSILCIEGYSIPSTADDTGGAIKRLLRKGIYQIEVRFKTHKEALSWGKKKMVVVFDQKINGKRILIIKNRKK